MQRNPVTFDETKISKTVDLPPVMVDDRKVFTVKLKVDIVNSWLHNESSARIIDPVAWEKQRLAINDPLEI